MIAMRKEQIWDEAFVGRVRNLQETYPEAHASLTNWGNWAADLRGVFPKQTPPGLWNQFKQSEVQEWGEEQAPQRNVVPFPVKAEAAPRRRYDAKTAVILDERMHGPGGLNVETRHCLRVAYVSHEVPEAQFPTLSGCSDQAFCERLEAALKFVHRFV